MRIMIIEALLLKLTYCMNLVFHIQLRTEISLRHIIRLPLNEMIKPELGLAVTCNGTATKSIRFL
jgi:hypothetical protein